MGAKKRKRNKESEKKAYSKQGSMKGVGVNNVISPFTKFTVIKQLMSADSNPGEDKQFYVRNITNQFTTHFHAYKSIIFEVMVDSDYIASITLFKV